MVLAGEGFDDRRLQVTGEGGLPARLTELVVESALEGEMDDHLGCAENDPAGRDGGDSRNGKRVKTVLTEAGPVPIAVPGDRDGEFEPKLVAERRRRLTGIDDMVISLSAKGSTTGEISAHPAEVYGAEVSEQTISIITDRVLDGMAEWQNRPLAGEHGDGEGAEYRQRVSTEIRNRGVEDVLTIVCDGLEGLPDADTPRGQRPRPLPRRASRPEMRLPCRHESGPDRRRPQTLVQPLERSLNAFDMTSDGRSTAGRK